jgi:hypothetical protein
MFKTPTLLAITVTLAMPSFADTAPKQTNKTAVNPANKKVNGPNKTGWIQVDSMQFGAGRAVNNSGGHATSKEQGQPNVNEINVGHGLRPVGAIGTPAVKIPTATDPCKAPNPPRSCKQSKPAH